MKISSSELKFIEDVFLKNLPGAEVFIFGSRATGENLKKTSDLDLVIKSSSKITFNQMFLLREALQESNLPYRVDLLDWDNLSEEFKNNIVPDFQKII